MRLFVTRHGESEANVSLSEYFSTPNYDIELTELGKQQAHISGKLISAELLDRNLHEPFFIYCSTYKRAIQTAEIISQYITHSKIIEDITIIEQNYGLAIGFASIKEYLKFENPEDEQRMFELLGEFYSRLPFGESKADVALRAEVFLQKVLQFKHVKNILVVSHKCFCSMLHKQIIGKYEQEFEWKNGETRVYQVENNTSNPMLWSYTKTI